MMNINKENIKKYQYVLDIEKLQYAPLDEV